MFIRVYFLKGQTLARIIQSEGIDKYKLKAQIENLEPRHFERNFLAMIETKKN